MNPTSLAFYNSRHVFKPTMNDRGEAFGLLTCPVRLAFTYFDPAKMKQKQNGKKVFSTIMIIPDGVDFAPLQAELARVATLRWGAAAQQMAASNVLKLCFKPQSRMQQKDKTTKVPLFNADGTPKLPNGFNTTGAFLEAESNFLPKFWSDTKKEIPESEGHKVFYAGVWAIAHLRFWAYPKPGQKTEGNQGVGCSLVDLQFLAHDDKLGGEGGSDGRNLDVIAHASVADAANANMPAGMPMGGMMAPPATAPAPAAATYAAPPAAYTPPAGPAAAPNPAGAFNAFGGR